MGRVSQTGLEEPTGLRIPVLMVRVRKGEGVGHNGIDRIITNGDRLIEELGRQRFRQHSVHGIRVKPHECQPALRARRIPKQRPQKRAIRDAELAAAWQQIAQAVRFIRVAQPQKEIKTMGAP